jgi:hypothetical protein
MMELNQNTLTDIWLENHPTLYTQKHTSKYHTSQK